MADPIPWAWHPHTPGVTVKWLASANGVSVWTIRRWRRKYPPSPVPFVPSREIGLEMAEIRPPGTVLPLWSRMAIAELAHEGVSYRKLAKMFNCSKSTVWRCVRSRSKVYDQVSGARTLSANQTKRSEGGRGIVRLGVYPIRIGN